MEKSRIQRFACITNGSIFNGIALKKFIAMAEEQGGKRTSDRNHVCI
ncbi:MAG: hypothetical protein RR071_08355 [Lachnospiraceae bacterium]